MEVAFWLASGAVQVERWTVHLESYQQAIQKVNWIDENAVCSVTQEEPNQKASKTWYVSSQ